MKLNSRQTKIKKKKKIGVKNKKEILLIGVDISYTEVGS